MKIKLRVFAVALTCMSATTVLLLIVASTAPAPVRRPVAIREQLAPIEEYTGMRIGNHTAPRVMSEEERQGVYEWYEELHARIMDEDDTSARKRFLVVDFHPSVGMGNRLLALVSAYVVAMATERALLVRWGATGMLKTASKEPVKQVELDALFVDPGFRWNYRQYSGSVIRRLGVMRYGHTKTVRFHASGGSDPVFEIMLCENYTATYDRYPTLHWSGVQDYYLPLLQLNGRYPGLAEWIWRVFGDTPFTHVARHLVRPVDEVRRRVQRELSALAWPYTAVQLRTIFIDNTRGLSQCISANESLLLITDDRPAARKLMRGRKVALTANVTVDRTTLEGHYSALVEMELMISAARLVVTEISTYGAVAYAMRGRPLHVLSKDGSCRQRTASQPFQWSFHAVQKDLWCARKTLYGPAARSVEVNGAMYKGGNVRLG